MFSSGHYGCQHSLRIKRFSFLNFVLDSFQAILSPLVNKTKYFRLRRYDEVSLLSN